jgi:hypothetical protein
VEADTDRCGFEFSNKLRGVRDDEDLRVGRGRENEARKGGQQLGMQAGFRFVEDHELGWTRCEQGCRQQEVAQGAVG